MNNKQTKNVLVFNENDLKSGKIIYRDLDLDIKSLLINDLISYFTHHNKLNKEDTRKILLYLLSLKYNIFDKIIANNFIHMDELVIMSIIWEEYYNTRDYKLLQKIYDKKYNDIFAKYTILFCNSQNKHSLWILTITSWDLSFTRFIYKLLHEFPKESNIILNKSFSPDSKYIIKVGLMDINSSKYKDIAKKFDKLSNIKL